MPGTPQQHSTGIPVFRTGTVFWGAECRRLRDFLIGNAIEFLLSKEVVVTVEEGRDVVVNKDLVYWRSPDKAVLVKSIAPIQVISAPFLLGRKFSTTPAL